MSKQLVDHSLFLPNEKTGVSYCRDLGVLATGLLSSDESNAVRSLQTYKKLLSKPNTTEPVAFDIQTLRVTHNSLEAMKAMLEKKSGETIWHYAEELFDYEHENSSIALMKVWIDILLENQERTFLVLILSQQLDKYVYSAILLELIDKEFDEEGKVTKAELEELIHIFFDEAENNEMQILLPEGVKFPEDKADLIFTVISTAIKEGRIAYWETFNLLVIDSLNSVILQETGLKTEQNFDDDLIFNVSLNTLEEIETSEALIQQQSFDGQTEDSNGVIAQMRGQLTKTYPVITEEDRENTDFNDDDIYYDEAEEVLGRFEAEYLHRDSGLVFNMVLELYEFDSEKSTTSFSITYDSQVIQNLKLDFKHGLRITDTIDPDLLQYLKDKSLSLPGTIAKMMQNIDRTLSLVSYK